MARQGTAAPPAWPAPATLRIVLWLALLAGLAEGAVRLFQRGILGRVTLVSPHIIWLAPVADLVWIGAPAVVLLLARRLPGLRLVDRLVMPVLFSLAALTLVLLVTSMHKGIALLLAAAIGLRAAQLATRHARGFLLLVRRSTPVLLGLAILAGGLIAGVRRVREARALAARPDLSGRPNVLLIIWDTVRGEDLSLYGYARPTTPHLSALARRGVVFDQAFAPAPWTLPSHAAIFTSRRPGALSARLNTPLDDRYPTLAEYLQARGYATGGFVANMSYTTRQHGLSRGFLHYEDHRLTLLTALGESRLGHVLFRSGRLRRVLGWYDLPERKPARIVTNQFLRWVAAGEHRPFFAFLNYFDAHQPYIPPQQYSERFAAAPDPGYRPRTVEARYRDMTAGEIRWTRDRYDAAIAYQDSELGRLLKALAQDGILDQTIVIVSSDHGEHFGEHNRISHGNSLYSQLLRVPLVIGGPGGPRGLRVEQPVSLRDLGQTIFDLAGLDDTIGFPGRSLSRFWRQGVNDEAGTSAHPVLSELPTRTGVAMSLADSGYHYISWFKRDPELYSLARDPQEKRNLAEVPAQADLLGYFTALRDSLAALLGSVDSTSREPPSTDGVVE